MLGSPVAWVLLPFLLAGIAGVWWAITVNRSQQSRHDEIAIWTDRMRLAHWSRTRATRMGGKPLLGRRHLHDEGGPVAKYLTLRGGERVVVLGGFPQPRGARSASRGTQRSPRPPALSRSARVRVLPEHPSQDLARGRLWHRLDEGHAGRHLVMARRAAKGLGDLGLGQRRCQAGERRRPSGASPASSSGTPITATSATPDGPEAASTSAGATWKPLTLISSFSRSTDVKIAVRIDSAQGRRCAASRPRRVRVAVASRPVVGSPP